MEYSYTKEEIAEMQNVQETEDNKYKQIDLWWRGPIGRRYCDRVSNIIDPRTRTKGFKFLVGGLPIKTILEVGCNRGHNLTALSMIKGKNYELHGIDPFGYALDKGRENGCLATLVEANVFNIPYPDNYFNLVFTYGVLMHISSKYLLEAIRQIYRVSNRYMLIIEYVSNISTQETIVKDSDVEVVCYRDYTNVYPNLRACGALNKREFPDVDINKPLFAWLFEKLI